MKIHNGEIRTLTEELYLWQLDDLVSKTEANMQKINKENKKKALIAFAPFSMAVLASLLLKDLTPLVIGTMYVSGCAIAVMVKDVVKESKRINCHDTNIIKLNDDDPYNISCSFYSSNDFLNDDIKNMAKEKRNDDELWPEPFVFLTIDDVKKRINFEYNVLNRVYNLPPIMITDREWEEIYALFARKINDDNQLDELYDKINRTLRLTIAYCLLRKAKRISLKDFIGALEYLAKVIGEVNYQEMACELSDLLPSPVVIDIKPLLKKKWEKNL